MASLDRPNTHWLSRPELERLYKHKIREWNVSAEQLKKRGWKLLTVQEALRECPDVNQDFLRASQGCVFIPYRDRDGNAIEYATNKPFYSLRFLGALPQIARKDKPPKELRYLQPLDSGVHLYFAGPLADGPLFITEGPSKTEAATAAGFNTIGLISVTCWNTPELEAIDVQNRDVFIVFDSDAVSNPNVCREENNLAHALTQRGARLRIVRLSAIDGLKKVGWDDFLRERGVKQFRKLLEDTELFSESEALHKLNEEVRYIRNPSAIVKLSNSQVMSCATFTNEAFYQLKYKIRELMPQGGVRVVEKRTAKEWIGWPLRAEVERMTYAPGDDQITRDGELNRWKGWGCEPKKGDVTPFLKLVDFLCAGIDQDHKKWFLQWLAYPIQNPGKKLYGAVCMWGSEQGTGKSLVGNTMGEVYGENFSTIINDELASPYNASWAECKQFVLGDEITCSEDNKKTIYDRLKSWITQPKIKINQKYVPTYDVPDRINYYFTSNSPDAFYLADEDRRFFVIEVKGKALPDKFYKQYVKWLQKEGGASALFYYLLHEVDLTGFVSTARPPETSAKRQMIENGRTAAERFVKALRTEPDAITTNGGVVTKYKLYTIKELTAFAHLHSPKEEHKFITETALGKALLKSRYQKIQCNEEGRIKIKGEGFPYVWIIRDEKNMVEITDPDVIREIYTKERA